jgi:hypothetical protein
MDYSFEASTKGADFPVLFPYCQYLQGYSCYFVVASEARQSPLGMYLS